MGPCDRDELDRGRFYRFDLILRIAGYRDRLNHTYEVVSLSQATVRIRIGQW